VNAPLVAICALNREEAGFALASRAERFSPPRRAVYAVDKIGVDKDKVHRKCVAKTKHRSVPC